MANLLSLSVLGLNAARAGLNVTAQNINNVNTEGYHRKSLVQSAVYPTNSGYGYPGDGVRLDDVKRVYDRFLDTQVQTATAQNKYYATQTGYLNQLDEVIANSTNGIAPRLQTFFSSIQTLTSDPASMPSRQAVVDQMSSLVTTMKSSDARITELRGGVNVEVKSAVTAINSLSQEIANLNKQITYLWRNDNTRLPNDLIDKRDHAITELNKYVKATSVPLDNGGVNVYMGIGQSLVLHDEAMILEAAISGEAGREGELGVYYTNGGRIEIPADMLTGGALGGALEVRKTLDETQQRLGQMAMEIAQRFNEQNKHGLDFNGEAGQELFRLNFSFPPLNQGPHGAGPLPGFNPTTAYNNLNPGEQLAVQQRYAVRALEITDRDPRKIAAASVLAFDRANSTLNHANKISTAALSAVSTRSPFDVNNPVPTMPLDIKFNGTHFEVAAPTTPAGMQIRSVAGVTGGYEIVDSSNSPMGIYFTVTGEPQNGDILKIARRTAPFTDTGDNSNLLEIARLQTLNTMTPQVKANKTSVDLLNTEMPPAAPKQAFSPQSFVSAQGSFAMGATKVDFVMPAQDPSDTHAVNQQRALLAKMPFTMDFDPANLANSKVPEGFELVAGATVGNYFLKSKAVGTEPAKNMMVMKLSPVPAAATKLTFAAPPSNDFQASFGQLATMIGSRTNEVQVVGEAAKVTLKDVTASRESVSGVNLDEEAANLMKYQQAYQAASKAIQVGQGLFDAVIDALR